MSSLFFLSCPCWRLKELKETGTLISGCYMITFPPTPAKRSYCSRSRILRHFDSWYFRYKALISSDHLAEKILVNHFYIYLSCRFIIPAVHCWKQYQNIFAAFFKGLIYLCLQGLFCSKPEDSDEMVGWSLGEGQSVCAPQLWRRIQGF